MHGSDSIWGPAKAQQLRVAVSGGLLIACSLLGRSAAAEPELGTDAAEQAPSAEAVQPPELRRFVDAAYPATAKAHRLEADVVLALTVGTDGKVTDVEVIEAAGHGFDEAAAMAAREFVFVPASRAGVPVAARILYRYSFRLDPPASGKETPETPSNPPSSALHGRLTISGGKVPLAGASVIVIDAAGTRHSAVTAEDGAFELVGLAPGRAELWVVSPGMRPFVEDLELLPDRVATHNAMLERADDETLEVSVAGERHPAVTERRYSRREMQTMPGALGDSLRAVQNLPGVGVPPLGTPDLVVRGMGPRANLVFVDGLLVLNAYHQWGISAVVPTEMLEELSFFPGNYGVEYGRGMGSMVELWICSAAAVRATTTAHSSASRVGPIVAVTITSAGRCSRAATNQRAALDRRWRSSSIRAAPRRCRRARARDPSRPCTLGRSRC